MHNIIQLGKTTRSNFDLEGSSARRVPI